MVEVIVEAKGSPYRQLGYELPLACKNGDLRMVKLLLSKLSWRNSSPWDIPIALRNAVKRGHAEIVNAILEAAPPNFVKHTHMAPSLFEATRKGYWDIAKSLICHGIFTLHVPPSFLFKSHI